MSSDPLAPELVLLQEEIGDTPDRGVLDGDPEELRHYLEFLKNLHVTRNPIVSNE